MPPVRVRFAPSPTGYLHVGGARTALFNWLFARRQGGVYILRIEDTDADRSRPELTEAVIEGLRWLGLDWDEGPFHQSERLESYRALADRLEKSGHAYPCFCTPGELDLRRKTAEKSGKPWKYDGRCPPRPPPPPPPRGAGADAHEMRISHVIRGADHLSNTPKQILMYQALGETPPIFAPLPPPPPPPPTPPPPPPPPP